MTLTETFFRDPSNSRRRDDRVKDLWLLLSLISITVSCLPINSKFRQLFPRYPWIVDKIYTHVLYYTFKKEEFFGRILSKKNLQLACFAAKVKEKKKKRYGLFLSLVLHRFSELFQPTNLRAACLINAMCFS